MVRGTVKRVIKREDVILIKTQIQHTLLAFGDRGDTAKDFEN